MEEIFMIKIKNHKLGLTCGLALGLGLSTISGSALAADTTGITKDSIKVGSIGALSGPLSVYAPIYYSMEAYFKKVNAEGGVHGRKIEFILEDGQGSPQANMKKMRKLVQRDKVAVTIGTFVNNVVKKTRVYTEKKKVPQVLNLMWSKDIFSLNYPHTTGGMRDIMAMYSGALSTINKHKPSAKIAFFYNAEDIETSHDAFMPAVKKYPNMKVVSVHAPSMAEPSINSLIIKAKASGADVVYLSTLNPQHIIQGYKKIKSLNWNPMLLDPQANINLFRAAGDSSKGTYSNMEFYPLPHPEYEKLPQIVEYKEFMKEYMPKYSYANSPTVWGYNLAKYFVKALHDAGPDLTREKILAATKNIKVCSGDSVKTTLAPGVCYNPQWNKGDPRPITAVVPVQFDGKQVNIIGPAVDSREKFKDLFNFRS